MAMETKDLIIRETVLEDVEYFYRWEQIPSVSNFFSINDNQTRDEAITKFVIDRESPARQQFTVLLKQTGKEPEVIGRVVIGDIEPEWKAEIWRIYIADTALRGKGLGKQTMEAILKHCFVDMKLERLYLDYYTGNPAQYLYESLGFKHEGCLRNNCRKNNILHDVNLMSMLKDEYFAKYK